ncbi:MAG: DASS family sodium-coupled anion symporter [Rhodothermia bacterium]|nr:MAG: DASS family sodium-coupled anion symporter [Rhodothermia bacterium]
MDPNTSTPFNASRVHLIGLFAGPAGFLLTLVLAPPEGLSLEGWRVAGVGLLMAVWWMTEAVPIPATSLLPLVLFPLLGIEDIRSTAAPYANPLIYLFLGGFLIAEAVQRSGLHKRLALLILGKTGNSPKMIVAGFMVATAFLSMWVSNTATTLMMLPIGISVVHLASSSVAVGKESIRRFGTLLMLSIAYSASVGGVGTLVGTPPNALMAGFLEDTYGIAIGFAEWLWVGIPLVIIGLPVVYVILVYGVYQPEFDSIPGGRRMFERKYTELGPFSKREFRVSLVFFGVALLWITRPLLTGVVSGLSDPGIAMAGTVILFVLPADSLRGDRLLAWSDATKIPWGVLILFGGGLSLAGAIDSSGLAAWIGDGLSQLSVLPTPVVILIITTTVIFLTELTSNTATAAAFLPVVGTVAVVLTGEPLVFVIPATIAASCAFMLPVATPPNAVVYGSGFITLPEMARVGIYLNLAFIVIITIFSIILPANLLN